MSLSRIIHHYHSQLLNCQRANKRQVVSEPSLKYKAHLSMRVFIVSFSSLKKLLRSINPNNDSNQERMKVREVIPHIGPIPIIIPLKLFLEGIDFLADNVTSRVTCLSPFLILQRLNVITIIHFHKKNCFSRYFQRISKKYM